MPAWTREGHLEGNIKWFEVIGHGHVHLVNDLDLGEEGATASVNAGHRRALLDAVLLGDLCARVAAGAARAAAAGTAPREAAAQAGPLHGGTEDARQA